MKFLNEKNFTYFPYIDNGIAHIIPIVNSFYKNRLLSSGKSVFQRTFSDSKRTVGSQLYHFLTYIGHLYLYQCLPYNKDKFILSSYGIFLFVHRQGDKEYMERFEGQVCVVDIASAPYRIHLFRYCIADIV
ncbi:hypothetical protein JCM30204_53640 [Dysgonomonas termitidis]